MSSTTPAKRRRALPRFATSIVALSGSPAAAQTPPTALPPVEVTPPTDPNKTRARPLDNDGSGTTPRPAGGPRRDRRAAPAREPLQRRKPGYG